MDGKKWCDREEVNHSIQVPSKCFSDDDLSNGTLVREKSAGTRIASDASSWVYKIDSGTQQWAVRVPPRAITRLKKRYTSITRHLALYCLPFFAYTRYISQGIHVRGKWYPVIKMEWIDGVDLGTWISENSTNRDELLRMAAQWRGMIASLNGARIAHGNLESTNVIITSQNRLRLIDYENVWVPPLSGDSLIKPPHPNWEHPRRTGEKIDEGMDQFPAFVGYFTLLAAAEKPKLVSEHLDDDKVLFSADDFTAPDKSKVLNALNRSKAAGFKELVAKMLEWCAKGPDAMDFEGAVSDCNLPLPDMHPKSRKPQFGPKKGITIKQTEPDPGDDDDKVSEAIPDPDSKPLPFWRRWRIPEAAIGLLALLIVVWFLIPPPLPPVEVTFDLIPNPWKDYAQFQILSKDGDVLMTRSASDSIVCLPPGEYGYQFVDDNGKEFGRRKHGFSVRQP